MNQNVHYKRSDDFMDDGSFNESLSMNTETFYDEIHVSNVRKRCTNILKKFSYPIIISSALLAFILVIAFSVLINLSRNSINLELENSSNVHKKVNSSLFYKKLIYVDNNKIKAYDLGSKNVTILKEVTNEIVSFEVSRENIYWFEKNSTFIQSFFFSQTRKTVNFSKKLKPHAIAFDYLTKKFYIVDKSAGTINVIDEEGKYHGIVLSDIEKPHDLAIDALSGVMFIAQHLKSIIRANLDGSNMTVIISNSKVSGITINREKKIILWIDEKNGISCSDYNGENQKILTESPVSIKSMTFFEDYLFWLLPAYMNRNASLWSCNLIDGICKNYKKHDQINFQNPSCIKIYSAQLDAGSEDLQGKNPCKINNGNCSDLCLVTPGNQKSCACQVGYQLNLDYQFCRHTTEFLMYIEDHYVRGIILNPKQKEASNDAIIPTPFFTESTSDNNNIVDFEYDLMNDDFYFTDGKNIYLTSIASDSEQKNVVNVKNDYFIIDLAYDWLSGNLYYSIDSANLLENRIIAVTRSRQNNFIEKTIDIGNDSYQCPHSLLIDANRGYLFFSRCDSVYYENFHRKYVNGTQIKNLYQFGQQKELEIFALDHEEERIYYLDAGKHFIYHANYDFDRTSIDGPDKYITMDKITQIYVYKEHIYVTDSLNIWRFNKMTGDDLVHVMPKFDHYKKKISGLKIVSVSTYSNNNENSCEKNKGGCEQFCFSRPWKECSCEDSKKLQNNERCV